MTTRARPAAVELAAGKVAAWRLERQLLGSGATARRPEAVADALVGVQAQVLSAAALSIALRSRNGAVGATARALADRRLVRTWAMRGTLHVFSATDFPTIAAALRHRETWRNPVWLRYFKVTEAAMEGIIEGVAEILDDGRPRSRAELSAELGARLGPEIGAHVKSGWGTFLKPAAMRGYLVQSGDGAGVTYVRPDRWLAAWTAIDPDQGLRDVLRRYLAAYGPASKAEILRWWGAQQPKLIRPALDDLLEELAEVDVDGRRGLIRREDIPSIEAASPMDDGVHLLGPFDPLIVGAGLRDLLIPAAHTKRVSRTAGWISPVVLVGGEVVGVWTSAPDGDRLRLTIDLFGRPSAVLRRAIEVAATRVGAVQSAEVRVAYGRVFAAAATGSDDD